MASLPLRVLLPLLPYFLSVSALASGSGTTTRYWDCCKPSCAWSGKTTLAAGSTPVNTCSISNTILSDSSTASACDGGSAYMCSNESPWAVNDDLAYGYAAVNIEGGTEDSWCCACYELTFTSGAVAGKKMIVQATNTGGDLAGNQFDISIPGGGVGIFNACTAQYGAPSTGWGAQYGGISSRSDCDSFPTALQDGCYWRFDWFMGADNPTVEYTQVQCPAALTANTGCTRADDSSAPAAPSVPASSSTAAPASTPVPASSSPTPTPSSSTVAPISVSSSSVALAPESATPVTALTSTSTAAGVEAVSSSSAVFIVVPSTTEAAGVTPTATTSAEAVSETPAGGDDDVCEL